MSTSITFNGITYTVPATGEESWGDNVSAYLIAIPSGCLQKTGGNFTLAADVNFGASFGLISKYFTSRSSNASSAGVVRLAVGDSLGWRNNANTSNLTLGVDGSDRFSFSNTIAVTGTANLSSLTASYAVVTDASKNLTSLQYTSSNVASTLVSRDSNSNVLFNNEGKAYTSTATSGITVSLTVSSTYHQYFTGSSNETVKLPDATTLPATGFGYRIVNLSSGTVTIQDNGGNSVQVMGSNSTAFITAKSISTANGSWDSQYSISSAVGTVTSVAMTVPSFLSVSGSPITSSGTLAVSLSGTALPVLNGGTGTTTSTGTGSVVLSASPTLTGTVTIPTPFTLGAVSVTSTGTQLNYLNAATGTTGTTSSNVVFSASPTFTGTVTIPTPFTLGAVSVTATGNQINYLNAATGTTGTTSSNVVFSASPTLSGPTFTGTTSLSALNATGTVNISGLTASQAVVTDGSKNLTSLSYVSTATASTLLSRDSNANAAINNLSENYSSTATSAGTTALSVSSSYQQYFTGTTTQTVTLPDATTLPQVGFSFRFVNLSTGAVTINDHAGGLVQIMAGSSYAIITAKSIASSAGSWDSAYSTNSAGGGTVTSVSMTVPSFLSVSGSPVTTAGTLAVSLSGTALPVANGGTGVTSVTISPTATAFAGWDSNKNLSSNSFLEGYTTTATAAGTTTLTVSSTYLQYFTGSTTQTVVLPVATTLVNGQSFRIVNNSTGAVTVQTSGANTVQAMAANTELLITCINTGGGTGTASWSWKYVPITVTGSAGSLVLSSSPTIASPTLSGTVNASGLSASQAVFTDGSKNLVSNATTGSGNVVMSASPTLSGNVGIGSSESTYQLGIHNAGSANALIQTSGSTNSASLIFKAPNGATNNFFTIGTQITALNAFEIYDNNNSKSVDIYVAGGSRTLYTNGTAALTLDSSQNCTIASLAGTGSRAVNASATGQLSAASDSRLKTEVKAILPGLKEILQIEPKAYQWNKEIERLGANHAPVEIGFFADHVAPIIPSAAPLGGDGYYGFYDRSVTAALVKAVQELKAEIEELKKGKHSCLN